MKHASALLRDISVLILVGSVVSSCGHSDQEPSTTSDARGSTNVGGMAASDTAIPSGTAVTTDSSAAATPVGGQGVERKYGLESGIVRFRNSALDREQIFYFDRYGQREALFDVVPPGAEVSETPYFGIIQVDGVRQLFDLKGRRGSRQNSGVPTGAILGTIPDVWNRIPISRNARQAEDLPPREILGRKAEGYAFQETGHAGSYKVWVWNQIPLYSEIRLTEETLVLEALSIEENVPIPEGTFVPPRDVVMAIE